MKGASTRSTILEAALGMARLEGLDALSIGRLAKTVGLSKSGLFAHFNSKQTLQLQVLERGVATFVQKVVMPSLKEPRGEPRLRAFFENWLRWGAGSLDSGGCLFLGAAVEYDDKPGPVRDCLVESQRDWTKTLSRGVRICQQERHIAAVVEPEQMAFEIYSIMMGYHLYQRLLGDTVAAKRARDAFEKLLDNHR